MLGKQEYCGDIINFKTYSKSYKNKKRFENDKENWVIFKDVHEPIIKRSVWELVQEKRGRKAKRKKVDGERNMFSGLLVCADCGSNLGFHFNQKNPDIQYFNCMGYNRGSRKICTSTHYIRVDFLEKVVLGEIRRLTKLATQYEPQFAELVMGHSIKEAEHERQLKQKTLAELQARDRELDNLFEHIYEDNVTGKISDDRFAKLSVKVRSGAKGSFGKNYGATKRIGQRQEQGGHFRYVYGFRPQIYAGEEINTENAQRAYRENRSPSGGKD